MNVYIGEPVEVNDMQGPCPDGFHVPLNSEWVSVYNIGIDLGAWTSSGMTIFSNYLKLPYAGYLYKNSGAKYESGENAEYWTSTRIDNNYAYSIEFNTVSSVIFINYDEPLASGLPIRGFKDTPLVPDSNWTTIYQGTGTAGIYYNSSLGVISLSSDGENWITIADKNVGATTVWNSGDTLTTQNCGNYYQRGNNYGFIGDSTPTVSSSQVDASSYGPGNYYSSSTFIVRTSQPFSWDSSNNANLRGGETQGTSTKSVEVQNIYIGKKPYDGKELCFTAQEANSTVTLNKYDNPTTVTLETSTDGETWSTYTFGTTITLSNVGDKVYWRNTSTTTTGFSKQDNFYRFSMTGTIAASGDLNYLVNKNSTTTLVGNYCFSQLFINCSSLTSAPELPATTLTEACYAYLFGRTSITTPPKLPATTLAVQCYSLMFWKCTALNALPKLPATTLTTECYKQMFQGCTSIKLSSTQTGEYQTAYRIPTTGTGTTATNAFGAMFYGTGGTYTSDPTINTTYYTSNTVV